MTKCMPSQMNEHVGGTESICPEELTVCLFTWKNSDPEGLSCRDENKQEVLSIKDVIGNLEYISVVYLADVFSPFAVTY